LLAVRLSARCVHELLALAVDRYFNIAIRLGLPVGRGYSLRW